MHLVAAAANAHDSPLLEPTLAGVPDAVGPLPDGACVHLDAGYYSGKTRSLLHILGYDHQIATKGKPSPIQVGKRWVVERTHSWMNGYGKLRRSTRARSWTPDTWFCWRKARPRQRPSQRSSRVPDDDVPRICPVDARTRHHRQR